MLSKKEELRGNRPSGDADVVRYYETRRGFLFADAQTQLVAFERLWQALGIVMIYQAVLDKAAEKKGTL